MEILEIKSSAGILMKEGRGKNLCLKKITMHEGHDRLEAGIHWRRLILVEWALSAVEFPKSLHPFFFSHLKNRLLCLSSSTFTFICT